MHGLVAPEKRRWQKQHQRVQRGNKNNKGNGDQQKVQTLNMRRSIYLANMGKYNTNISKQHMANVWLI
jgi:hypothetical protein